LKARRKRRVFRVPDSIAEKISANGRLESDVGFVDRYPCAFSRALAAAAKLGRFAAVTVGT